MTRRPFKGNAPVARRPEIELREHAMWKRIYSEGRCLRCGMRITVDCKDRGHTRDGQWCGPIETDHPFAVPDQPGGKGWMVRESHGLTPPHTSGTSED